MSEDTTKLTLSQLREVIERAARISDPRDRVSIAELREIAEELELDPLAVEQALAEVLAEAQTERRGSLGGWLEVPTLSELRARQPLALLVFFAAAALITPGDSVALTLMLGSPMAVLYELCIRLLSRASTHRGGGDPPSGAAPASASSRGSPEPGSIGDGDIQLRGLAERIAEPIRSLEEGMRAFQMAVRRL